MRTKGLPFHIQQNTTPEMLKAILACCVNGTTSIGQLAQGLNRQVGTVQHIVSFIRQLGLLETSHLGLTAKGVAFHRLNEHRPSLLPEAVHYCLYTAHVFEPMIRFSWAYSVVVNALWTSGTRVLDSKGKAQLVGTVVQQAEHAFGMPVEQIAFSHNSIRGALNWLQALDPPVVTNTGKQHSFRRRYFCPPVTFLWAVDFLYRADEKAHGVRIFLTSERIDRLCKLCVLDPSGLDNVLMMAKRTSDYDHGGLFDYGTEGGFGRWILLVRSCPVPTLPEEIEA